MTENNKTQAELLALYEAIDKSLGTIEFNMDGTIITANENFLKMVGYSLEEVQGKHHRMFVSEQYANSQEYTTFWEQLNKGEFHSGEYKRVGKNKRPAYIRATYNPIMSEDGKPLKVIKIASDITQQKMMEIDKNRQSELIMEMSTPVMRLLDSILLLPVVGMVDSSCELNRSTQHRH